VSLIHSNWRVREVKRPAGGAERGLMTSQNGVHDIETKVSIEWS